jgi:hypothetical protein
MPNGSYHLYYPSRRQLAPAFVLLVDELRFRGGLMGKRSQVRVAEGGAKKN